MDFSQDFVILCGASVRAAAEAAQRHFKNIVGIDFFGDSDLRGICAHWTLLDRTDPARSIGEALEACGHMVSGGACLPETTTKLIPVIFTGGYESWGEKLKDNIPEAGQLLAPPWDVVQMLRSSDFLESVADKSGVLYPVTVARDGYEEWKRSDLRRSLQASEAWGRGEQFRVRERERWLVKRTQSAGGLEVRFADPERLSGDLMSGEDGQFLLQQYIPGIPIGANFIANGRDVGFLGAARSIVVPVGDRPFVYGGSWGMLQLGSAITSTMMTAARQVVRATGLCGLFGIDFQFRRSDRSLWILEINPRYTASMELVERGVGVSLLDAHRRCFSDNQFDVCDFANGLLAESRLQSECFIKKIIWSPSDAVWSGIEGTMVEFQGSQEAPYPVGGKETPFDDLRFALADIPEEGTLIAAGEPVATLICRGPSWISIRRMVERVERELLGRIAVDG